MDDSGAHKNLESCNYPPPPTLALVESRATRGPGRQWATTTTIYPQNTRIRQPGEEEWRPEYNGFAIALNNGHPNPNVSLHRLIVRWAIAECLTSHHHRHRHCTFNGDCCELEHPDDDDVDHPSIHASSQVTKPTKWTEWRMVSEWEQMSPIELMNNGHRGNSAKCVVPLFHWQHNGRAYRERVVSYLSKDAMQTHTHGQCTQFTRFDGWLADWMVTVTVNWIVFQQQQCSNNGHSMNDSNMARARTQVLLFPNSKSLCSPAHTHTRRCCCSIGNKRGRTKTIKIGNKPGFERTNPTKPLDEQQQQLDTLGQFAHALGPLLMLDHWLTSPD